MYKTEKESVEQLYFLAMTEGEAMAHALGKVFKYFEFDTSLITRYGVLSVDIDHGPEIVALKNYNPHIHFVAEPLSGLEERDEIDRQNRLETYRRLKEERDVRVLDDYSYGALEQLNEIEQHVGLITVIRPFPTSFTSWYVEGFVRESASILVPGGMLVIGTNDQDIDIVFKDVEIMVGKQKIDELEVKYTPTIPNAFASAGNSFLTAQKRR